MNNVDLTYPISKLDPLDLSKAIEVLDDHLGIAYARDPFYIDAFSFEIELTTTDLQTQQPKINKKASIFELYDFIELGNMIDPKDKSKRIRRKGIVTSINDSRLEDGRNIRTVKGSGLGFILMGTPIEPPNNLGNYISPQREYISQQLSVIFKDLVDTNRIQNTYDSDMNIPGLTLKSTAELGPVLTEQFRFQDLITELKRMSVNNGFGWQIEYTTGTSFEFSVFEGVDRTAIQAVNTRAIFSIELENVKELTRDQDIAQFRQVAKVAGQGEGIAREIIDVSISSTVGWKLKKVFIDARDIDLGDTSGLNNRGTERLKDYSEIDVVNVGGFISRDNLVYLRDFDLLDKITVEDSILDISIDLQITKAIENYLPNQEFKVEFRFGKNQNNLAEAINQKLKNTSNEVLR